MLFVTNSFTVRTTQIRPCHFVGRHKEGWRTPTVEGIVFLIRLHYT